MINVFMCMYRAFIIIFPHKFNYFSLKKRFSATKSSEKGKNAMQQLVHLVSKRFGFVQSKDNTVVALISKYQDSLAQQVF
jgi:hypothetical protein